MIQNNTQYGAGNGVSIDFLGKVDCPVSNTTFNTTLSAPTSDYDALFVVWSHSATNDYSSPNVCMTLNGQTPSIYDTNITFVTPDFDQRIERTNYISIICKNNQYEYCGGTWYWGAGDKIMLHTYDSGTMFNKTKNMKVQSLYTSGNIKLYGIKNLYDTMNI